jgi:hypothetical protein
MTRMRVLKPNFRYGIPAKPYKQGDVIDVADKHVKTLELTKIAEKEGVMAQAKKKRGRAAGSIKKAGEPKTARAKRTPSKRTYNRRDMQAEK